MPRCASIARDRRAGCTYAVPISVVEAAQLALAAAEIDLERAQIALDDRFVRAPFASVLGLTDIDAGDRIDSSLAITTIDNRTALLVSFEVTELMLGAVRKGEQVEVNTWNQCGPTAFGEVVDIGSRIDPVTRIGVEIRELPDLDRPIVSVLAVFPAASPETMDAEVTSIIEGAVVSQAGSNTIEISRRDRGAPPSPTEEHAYAPPSKITMPSAQPV